ncbi:MAG: T9SS type A sorting domain-containing protein, partial [Marinirhabdus sp.]
GWPQDIVFLADQNEVLISNLSTNRITKYNATTGAYIEDFATVPGGPTRMELDSNGVLWVLQWSLTDNNVLRFTAADGTPLAPFTTTGVPRGIGLDWDSSGNLYVSSYSQGNVTQYDSAGNLVGEYVDNTELAGPTNIYFDDSDQLFVFDWSAGDVELFDNTGAYLTRHISGLNQVEGVDFLPNGNVLLGNGGTAEVKQYTPAGTFVENTVTASSGGLIQPNAVVLFDRETLSVPQNEVATTVFMTPSMGSVFTLNAQAISAFSGVGVYDTAGKRVRQISEEQTTWDASQLTEGIYFVVGVRNGKKTTQKIIVQK